MTRLKLLRIGWLAGMGVSGIVLLLLVPFRGLGLLVNLLIIVALLVPGRVQGHLYRDFFQGRNPLGKRRYEEALPYFDRFLARVRAAPWIKRAIWLSWPGYSTDIEAMTLTNLGAARFELGEMDAAEQALNGAIAIDPRTPIPWVNLGLVYATQQDSERAAKMMTEAQRLGYRGDVLDRIQQRLAGILAGIERTTVGAPPRAGA